MYLKIHVVAGAKTELLRQDKPDTFTVFVHPKAKQGQANKRMQELVGAHFGVPRGAVRLIAGYHQPSKMVSIEGIDVDSKKGV
jgi:uncharacterized protein YggU (UPF0235/DUF167 family)